MRAVDASSDVQQSRPLRSALLLCSDVLERFGRVLRHLIVGLVDQAVALRLVSSDARIESLTLGPVQTVVHEPIGRLFRDQKVQRLRDALAHHPPTIVHAFSGHTASYGASLAGMLDADLFVQVSSMRDADAIGRMDTASVSKFLVVSEPLVSVLEDQLGLPRDRIELIRPGVQVSEDISCLVDAGRAPTLLCMSHLSKDSGVDRLIRAVYLLGKRKLRPMLFILGDGPYESNLRALVRKRHLESQITFATPLGDTLSTMRSADIFVHPSMDSEFTTNTLTALGTGTLVIACRGVVDHLRHDETALVCEEPTAESLAGHLADALTNRDRAQRIARGGLDYVRKHHGVSGMAERVAECYRTAALGRATFRIKR